MDKLQSYFYRNKVILQKADSRCILQTLRLKISIGAT